MEVFCLLLVVSIVSTHDNLRRRGIITESMFAVFLIIYGNDFLTGVDCCCVREFIEAWRLALMMMMMMKVGNILHNWDACMTLGDPCLHGEEFSFLVCSYVIYYWTEQRTVYNYR